MCVELGVLPLLIQVTAFTVQPAPDMPLPPLFADDPRAIDPWGPVAHMLMMTTVEFRDPVTLVISVKRKNFSLHNADLILPWCI